MFILTRKAVIKGISYKAGDSIKLDESGLIERLLSLKLIEKSKKVSPDTKKVFADNKKEKK